MDEAWHALVFASKAARPKTEEARRRRQARLERLFRAYVCECVKYSGGFDAPFTLH